MPPDLANALAYSSVRNERHTPTAAPPPTGPSPSTPVNMCWNIELRNTASKSWAAAFAFILPFASAPRSSAAGSPMRAAGSPAMAESGVISHHLDVGLDRAGGLDRLEDRDHVARPDAERIEAVDQLLQRHAFAHQGELAALLLDADAGARHHPGLAARERRRLAHLRRLADGDGEVALRHRHGGHAHVAPHHDDAGALVDDDAGAEVGLDLQLLDLGQERHHVALVLGRHADLHGRGVERLGGRAADEIVDRRGDAGG